LEEVDSSPMSEFVLLTELFEHPRVLGLIRSICRYIELESGYSVLTRPSMKGNWDKVPYRGSNGYNNDRYRPRRLLWRKVTPERAKVEVKVVEAIQTEQMSVTNLLERGKVDGKLNVEESDLEQSEKVKEKGDGEIEFVEVTQKDCPHWNIVKFGNGTGEVRKCGDCRRRMWSKVSKCFKCNYIFCTRCKWMKNQENQKILRGKKNRGTRNKQNVIRNERRDEVYCKRKWDSKVQKVAPLVEIQAQQRDEKLLEKMSLKACEDMAREQERKEILLEWGDGMTFHDTEVITVEGHDVFNSGDEIYERKSEVEEKFIEWGILGDECKDMEIGIATVVVKDDVPANVEEERKRLRKQRKKKRNKKKGDGKVIDSGKIMMVFDQIGKDFLRDQGEKRVDESKNIGVAEEIWEKLNGFKSELLLAESEKKGKDVVRDIQLRLALFKAEVVDKDGNIRSKGVG